jgi:hypothetical protein
VTAVAGVASVLALGVALGLQFNPLTATIGAVVAAAAYGYPKAPEARRPIAVAVLALAWLAGDGVRIGAALATAPPKAWPEWASLVARVLASALVGYVAPAVAGIIVGRRVTRGTGWLSAGAVALMVAGALAVVSPTLADGVARLGGAS